MRNPGVFRGAFHLFIFYRAVCTGQPGSYVSVELADTGRYRLVGH